MHITQLVVGPLGTNCYLVREEGGNKLLIIDPGGEPQAILEALAETGGTVSGIVCTHGHPDHTGALRQVAVATGAPVHIHPADTPMLRRTWPEFLVNEAALGPGMKVREIRENDTVTAGKMALRVLHTPGHTPGSVCYITDGAILSGDTLFRGDIGRYDLPGGDYDALIRSLAKLSALTGEYKIYPGHGASTSLEYENANNLYMK